MRENGINPLSLCVHLLTGTSYCGNTFTQGSLGAPSSECNFPCMGSPQTQYCGAGNRLSIYSINGTSQSTSSSSSVSSSTSTIMASTSSSTSSSAIATSSILSHTQTIGDYSFVGCWTEATGTRALSEKSVAADAMTLEACAAYCVGFEYWGTEYGRECKYLS